MIFVIHFPCGANAWVALRVDRGKFFTTFVEDFQQLFTTAELSGRRDTRLLKEAGYLNPSQLKIKRLSFIKVKDDDDHRAV